MRILSLNLSTIISNRKIIAVGLIAFIGGMLLCGALINLTRIMPYFTVSGEPLSRFSSYDELVDFVGTMSTQPHYYFTDSNVLFSVAETRVAASSGDSGFGYSTTNVQVAGVDEADIVKSDGEYLYVVTYQTVFIIKAYPPEEAEILSRIKLNATIHGIFVNGDRLVVFGSDTSEVRLLADVIKPGVIEPYSFAKPTTFIKVYDVSDKADPTSARNVTVDGYYYSSRMIGNYVYTIVNEPTLLNGTEVKLPVLHTDYETVTIPATEIYYSVVTDYGFTFTSIFAVNVVDDAEAPTYETILLGTTRSIYVSPNNIYIAFGDVDSASGTEKTLIYRVQVDGSSIENKASGGVPGSVLNQFSMDEHEGFFRIATTVDPWNTANSGNNIYVLNMTLDIVGKLEDLALTERIYSARFMGDRCYLVTFQQVDPFFVIDLSSPTDPEVLGYLKIPGFSSYLHPYDENHIIGIGKIDSNVKMALFDVSDVSTPTETTNYTVPGEYSDSTVLRDHKAFLFDQTKQLLALPVSVNSLKNVNSSSYTYEWSYWQGAYIFDITLEYGFVLKGNVTHRESSTGYEYGQEVQRILYIGNVLYTVSETMVKMNNLSTLEEIGVLELS